MQPSGHNEFIDHHVTLHNRPMSPEAKCSARSSTVVLLMDLTRFNNISEGKKLERDFSSFGS